MVDALILLYVIVCVRGIETMVERVKKNIFLLIIGGLSEVGLLISAIQRTDLSKENELVGYIVWFYLLVSFLSWLNIYKIEKERRWIYRLDVMIQLLAYIILSLMRCDFFKIFGQESGIHYIAMICIGIELLLHIQLPLMNPEKDFDNIVQENEIREYFQNALMYISPLYNFLNKKYRTGTF